MIKPRVIRHAVEQPLDKPFRFIPLTQGQNAIVDIADFEWLSRWNWTAMWKDTSKSFYAYRGNWTTRRLIAMHRAIVGFPKNKIVDHKNRNTLDNRRENLRVCTKAQNNRNHKRFSTNRSGFHGVSFDRARNKWFAMISVGDRTINLGRYETPEDAARAYDAAAIKYSGEFAHLNFAK